MELEKKDKKEAFFLGWLGGVLFYLLLLHWILFANIEGAGKVWSIFAFFLLIAYLGVYFGVASFLSCAWKRPYLFPLFFTALEFFRSLSSSFGFPWGSLYYTHADAFYLNQIVSFLGPQVLTLAVLYINYFIYRGIKEKKNFAYAGGIVLFLFLYSVFTIHGKKYPGDTQVALVQLNIPPFLKRYAPDSLKLERIKTYAREDACLIVFPETASPCYPGNSRKCRKFFEEISRGRTILMGSPDAEYGRDIKRYRFYNAAILFEDGRMGERYRKIYLVPFVERLPYDDIIPVLRKLDFGQGNYSPGKEYRVFRTSCGNFSCGICFESIFPRIYRRFVRNGAEFFVNITEDSWFGRTPGPYQHFSMARMRAVEYRRYMLRCGNTGITGIIDPYGRVISKLGLFEEGVVRGKIKRIREKTPYAVIGDFVGWMLLLFFSLSLFFTPKPYYKHRTAVVDKGARIGEGTKIWHFSHIMGGAEIGRNCVIGQNCFVGRRAKIGNGVKIENNVSVFDLVTIEDDVFVGPSATFTNDINPRAPYPKHGNWIPTLVKRGATIGANATILPGVTIGEWAMVGAGSVVTEDVPAYAIVYGNPARVHGYICECGEKLKFDGERAVCEKCGRRYEKKEGKVFPSESF